MIKLGAAATVAASLGVGDAAARSRASGDVLHAQTSSRCVDELSEMIIPADAHSPGARAAKVAAYIDARLAEAWDEKDKTTWRDGLKLVDQLSQTTNGKPFMQSSPEQRRRVLTRMAQNERKPQKPEEQFFGELKSRVVHAYYTSEIGIKQEMEYKGNTYLAEFVGTDVS